MKNLLMFIVMIVSGLAVFEGSSDPLYAHECEEFTRRASVYAERHGYKDFIINCKTKEVKPMESNNYRAPAIVLK